MKGVITLFLLICLTLGLNAQPLSIDSTFQPFLDIREEYNYTSNIIEEEDGRIYLIGNFHASYQGGTNYTFYNSVCYRRDGSLFLPYNALAPWVNSIVKINDSLYFHNQHIGNGFMHDEYGRRVNESWVNNADLTVQCGNAATPLFFKDGSSLFVNRTISSTGKPCEIILPPDTFEGSNIVKLTPEGEWDSTFKANVNCEPRGFSIYDSNRAFVFVSPSASCSKLTTYNGNKINNICRFYIDDGSIDTTFQSPLDTSHISIVFPQAVDSISGKFMISGRFYLNDYPGQVFTLIRCHADGSIDTSFNNFEGPGSNNTTQTFFSGSITPTDDGGYIVGGYYDEYQGYQKKSLAKIDSVGNIKPQYFPYQNGPDSSSQPQSILPQIGVIKSKFGGYYIVGDFLKWDGKPSQPIVRIKEFTTSLEEKNRKEPEIEVFPNPSQSIFNVQATLPIKQMMLFNLNGSHLNTIKCTSNCSINLSNYSSGVYLLRLILDNGAMHHRKLIKH